MTDTVLTTFTAEEELDVLGFVKHAVESHNEDIPIPDTTQVYLARKAILAKDDEGHWFVYTIGEGTHGTCIVTMHYAKLFHQMQDMLMHVIQHSGAEGLKALGIDVEEVTEEGDDEEGGLPPTLN